MGGKTGQHLHFWATLAASKNGALLCMLYLMRMRIFDLNIKYLLIFLFINIWVGYLNITKCIDKGFLVL